MYKAGPGITSHFSSGLRPTRRSPLVDPDGLKWTVNHNNVKFHDIAPSTAAS